MGQLDNNQSGVYYTSEKENYHMDINKILEILDNKFPQAYKLEFTDYGQINLYFPNWGTWSIRKSCNTLIEFIKYINSL